MSRQARWSTRARLELARAIDYCAQRDPDWAFAIRDSIVKKIEFLCEFPYLSTPIARTHRREYREALAGSYRIFYFVNEEANEIFINSIRHVSQDDPGLLE